MRDKIVTAVLGDDLYVKTSHVFQYDYGLTLMIEGIQLPAEYEIHFSNKKRGVAKKGELVEGGAKIPDEYLRSGDNVYAWVYLRNGDDDGYTIYSIEIPVVQRSVEQGDNITIVEHNIIDEAIAALEDAVEKTDQNVRNYPYINEENHHWMVYDAELERFVDTGVKAQGDNTFNLSVGTVSTLAPGSQATASITWTQGGDALLNLGLPAGDASSMVSIHDERSDAASIEVHDGANNIVLDDMRIAIAPIQAGSGAPGPRNIRGISGTTAITLTHNSETYNVSFASTAGTVYSGTYCPLTGKLYVNKAFITKRCVDMNNSGIQPGWKDSGIRDLVGDNVSQVFTNQVLNIGTSYGVDTTNGNDILYLGYEQYGMLQSAWIATEITVQICVELPEAIEYNLDPIVLSTVLGDNVFSVNTGEIEYMKYPCDTKEYIDHKIAETQALVLEH